VDGVGLAVEFDVELAAGGIGAQIDAGGKESAYEAAGIVMAAEGLKAWNLRFAARASWTRAVSAR
jgi:hypothetical protein